MLLKEEYRLHLLRLVVQAVSTTRNTTMITMRQWSHAYMVSS